MEFREQLLEDLDSVFFNAEEFAESHMINGSEVNIVVDNDKLAELYLSKGTHTEQLFTDSILFYVRKRDLGFEPVPGQCINYDDRVFLISDVKTDDESYTIVMGANES
ncbi:MAG: hypothetical protein NC223_03150 [Butyrivibrio sp.]|nr:hypothetical protein [Butyrivibrio sp.]